MSSFSYRCARTRYLSPCRLSRHSLHHACQPRTRWHSQPPQSSRLVNGTASRGSSSISKKLPPLPTADIVEGWKNNALEWTMTKKSASLQRMVSALNIDLPSVIAPYYQRHRPGPREQAQAEPKPSQHSQTEKKVDTVDAATLEVDVQQRRERLKAKLDLVAASRQQHDLGDAITAMGENDDLTNHAISNTTAMVLHSSVVNEIPPNIAKEGQSTTEVNKPSPRPVKPSPKKKQTASTSTVVANLVKNVLPSSIMGKAVQKQPPMTKPKEKESTVKRQLVAKASIDRRTRGLVLAFRTANSATSKSVRLEELCRHLGQYPESTNMAVKEKVIPPLLRLLASSKDTGLQELAREALALVGYVRPVTGRGIRILTLDGGGTRGLVSIEMLRKIEENCGGKPIQDLFDYICGVSTGALIAMMVGVFRGPLDECAALYHEFSTEMFNRSRLMGAGKLFTSHAYYDAELFEKILHENIGLKSMLETSRDPKCPKIAAYSSLRDVVRTQIFMFRNYNLAPGVQSHYHGSSAFKIWEAIRASSAAPGYYQEKLLDGLHHVDGGVLINNPTAIAIHESRLLWPNTPIQCVVSVGTGRYESTGPTAPNSTYDSLKSKIFQIVQSATDTEAVHTVLQDLLPPQTYFRFNPYMSEDFLLDEVNPAKWEQMVHDTQMYSRKNDYKLKKAGQVLLQPKPKHREFVDWLKLRKDMIG